jgi:2-haloalkanoic acid dehalogenase type II
MATATPLRNIKALVFDAHGTLFDVFSVTALCDQLFPGGGTALAQLWRSKRLQYTLLGSLMGRYKDFWQLTADGLLYASQSLKLDLTASKQRQLMDAYLSLTVFPDVRPGLQGLKQLGLRLAILSNGEPKMLDAAARNAGIATLLDATISADELKAFKPSPRVYLGSYAIEGGRGRAWVCVAELLGCQRRRFCGVDDVQGSARRRRTGRGTWLCRGSHHHLAFRPGGRFPVREHSHPSRRSGMATRATKERRRSPFSANSVGRRLR